MIKKLRKLYYKIFPHYKVLERKFVPYPEGDKMIRDTRSLPEPERWVLDTEKEDMNLFYGLVHLCRRKRITE